MTVQDTPRTAKRRREAEEEEDEVLVLHAAPEAVRVKKPRLDKYPTIEVDDDNCVRATVNGRACCVCLDSGSSLAVLFTPLARVLGLVHGREATEEMRFDTWTGIVTLRVVRLPEVVLVLAGGVEVHTPAVVFPEAAGDGYDTSKLVLDVATLRRGHTVQSCRRGGSSLAIRRPDLLRSVPAPPQQQGMFTFRVRQKGSAAPLSVLLDTGSKNFAISRAWARRNRPCGGGKVRRVSLRLGAGCCLHAGKPGRLGSATQPFVLGLKPLRRHRAILDYSRRTLSFKCGDKRLKVDLHEE